MPTNANQPQKRSKAKKVIQLDNQPKNVNIKAAKRNESRTQTENKIMPLNEMAPEDIIFSLDIGTRTVVGVVGIPEGDKLKILAAEVIEHKNRAMLDGQIHDIAQVAEVTREVKAKLEAKLGIPLSRVAIAAAGRVLKTCEVKVERDIESSKEIDQELVSSIEMEGIQHAQLKLDEDISTDEKTQFYCVGYSVINYYLNGYIISSLLGHRGKRIGIDILATFLPHIVVDSLYTVMNKIGLEVVSLTLEPIAAINVTIPKDLRLLNLALVDIGAGTSDIALTRDGSVVAYAMAPVAGDEVTEKISQHYLVDFNTGEKIKIALSTKSESITFVDILGKKHTAQIKEVKEVIKSSVDYLAETISQKILEYNHKAPNAVFLIGGGSQIPGLPELIAENLKISKDRVVVRGRDIIQNIRFTGKKLSGPEAITPFGIAVTALMQKGQDFLAVTVNGKKIRLFNSKKLTVADALILIGFNPGQLIGRSGKSMSFEVNGQKKTIRGQYGKAAEIYINEKPGSLDTTLNIGDDIRVIPAEDGENASAKVSDFISSEGRGSITLNGSSVNIDAQVYINGKATARDQEILEGDRVQYSQIKTLQDLVSIYEIDVGNYDVLVNGEAEERGYCLKDGDRVEVAKSQANAPESVGAAVQVNTAKDDMAETGSSVDWSQFYSKGRGLSIVVNGKPVEIKGEKNQYIFVDIFNFIDFDLSKPKGNIVLKLNGRPAAFTDPIGAGDMVDIYWDK